MSPPGLSRSSKFTSYVSSPAHHLLSRSFHKTPEKLKFKLPQTAKASRTPSSFFKEKGEASLSSQSKSFLSYRPLFYEESSGSRSLINTETTFRALCELKQKQGEGLGSSFLNSFRTQDSSESQHFQ